jgi:hypothetical protein
LPSHLNILNYVIDLFNLHFKNDSERSERFKNGFLDFITGFEMRDFLDLKLSQIILFLGIYSDLFTKNRKYHFY